MKAAAQDSPWSQGHPGPDGWSHPGPRVVAGVVFAIGCLTGLTVWGQFSSGVSKRVPLVLDISVGVASVALVPVALRWPVAGALALSVLAAISPAATPAATVAVLLVAQRRPFRVAVAVAGVGVAAHLVRGAWLPVKGLPMGGGSCWWS